MKIDQIKFMNAFTKKRAEIEKILGRQSFYLIARSMGVKQRELMDFVLEGKAPPNLVFAKMCQWLGKTVDDFKINA